MSSVIPWIAAEAEKPNELFTGEDEGFTIEDTEDRRENRNPYPIPQRMGDEDGATGHRLAPRMERRNASAPRQAAEPLELAEILREHEEIRSEEETRERRILRGRTVGMLRRYLRYSIETGRLPSVLGQEFFRAKVTSYNVATFEDRVIFVHDMERCLDRLDEFSRQLIARHILQEHDCDATAQLLHCGVRTVQRWTPFVLDCLGKIFVEMGLLERIEENSCQGGFRSETSVSDCDDGKNNRNYNLHDPPA